LGAKVLHFDWIDDFSAARNFVISNAPANEYFAEEDVPFLYPLIKSVDRQYASTKGKRQRDNVIEMPWINGNVTRQSRVFINVPYLRYAGALHEKLHAINGGCRSVYSVKDKPAIYHSGYVRSESNRKEAKGARNFEIAQKSAQKLRDTNNETIKKFSKPA